MKVLGAKEQLVKYVSCELIRKQSCICVYVCLLRQRERSVGHTPNGDQHSTLGMGVGVANMAKIIQTTCLFSEFFIISLSHFYSKNNF